MTEYILIALQIIVFAAFITFIWKKFGVLDSLSDSWYELRKKGRLYPALFTIVLWAVGLPMYFLDSDWFQYGAVSLMITGTAPMFRERVVKTFHVASAYGSIAFCLYGLIEIGNPYPAIAVVISGILAIIFKISNKTWWVEILSFIFIEAGRLYNLINH